MDPQRRPFRVCALASGLVTQADLDEAVATLWHQRAQSDTQVQVQIDDRELADQLVKTGRLTSYQANRLLAGYTKLHLERYRILDWIGRGGMGEVFKAEHIIMGRIVAVKVLPRNKTTPAAIASFMHEIRAQARLRHDNLVQALDAGHDDVYFLVTEYVPGTDLRKFVRQHGPFDMRGAATIISQAASGLDHAHAMGLIHRDVKPGNLLVTPTGMTKVSDLGLAGWLNETEADPRAGKIVGTADYLSPEQIVSPKDVTPTSDIYSLGCSLYYAVTGKVPFPGGTSREKAKRHLEDTPIHPRRLNPSLSDEFVDVIAQMMDKSPSRRIQTAAEVIQRLKPWAEDHLDSNALESFNQRPLPQSKTPSIPQHETVSDGAEEIVLEPETEWQLEEGLSQASLGTEPFAAAEHETIPSQIDSWIGVRRRRSLSLEFVLIPVGVIAVLTLLVVLITALLR